nr:uncharacterized protein LOC120368318 [Saimiri boliviensis boliviensis]
MHVPSVAAAGERGDGRTLQFLHTPPGAPDNKSFAGAWAEAGVRGARRRGTIGAEPQAAGWALPASPRHLPARLGSARLHSRVPSSPPGSRALRPARARPTPSRPLSPDLTPRGVPTELSKAEQVPRLSVLACSPGLSRPP